MSIDLLLTLCVILLSVGLTVIAHTAIKHLQSEIRHHKFSHESITDEAHEWEKKALTYALELQEERTRFEDKVQQRVLREKRELESQYNVKSAPDSHNVQPIDTEQIIANSDDPVWPLVEECRDLMPQWELKNPGIAAAQSHHRYSQFATFIANLCDEHRNRDGVAKAIELLKSDPRG